MSELSSVINKLISSPGALEASHTELKINDSLTDTKLRERLRDDFRKLMPEQWGDKVSLVSGSPPNVLKRARQHDIDLTHVTVTPVHQFKR